MEAIQRATVEFNAEAKVSHAADTQTRLKDIRRRLSDPHPFKRFVDAVFSVPWAQNDRFLGRNQDLNKLSELLHPEAGRQKSCVLHGMAGVGKTQTALEFCYQQRAVFPYVLWIPAEDEAILAHAYASIMRLVEETTSSPKPTAPDPSSEIEASRRWLCQRKSPAWAALCRNSR